MEEGGVWKEVLESRCGCGSWRNMEDDTLN